MPSAASAAFARLVEARPAEPPGIWFDTACVLGGSIAGLLAARVLADHAGRRWLEHWLPGLTRDLQDGGAVLSGRGQFVQYTDGRPQVHEQPLLTSSRPLLESRIRARVLALPNDLTRWAPVNTESMSACRAQPRSSPGKERRGQCSAHWTI